MEHGTLWGHGAYLGPDYTAAYLHRTTEVWRDALAKARHEKPFTQIDPAQSAAVSEAIRTELKANRYDPATGTLTFTPGESASFIAQKTEWRAYFGSDSAPPGLPPHYIDDRSENRRAHRLFRVGRLGDDREPSGRGLLVHEQLAIRPGSGQYPHDRRLPLERDVAHHAPRRPGGRAPGCGAFRLPRVAGDDADGGHAHDSRLLAWRIDTEPEDERGSSSGVVAVLFVAQSICGGALAHYRVEPGAFYGFDLAKVAALQPAPHLAPAARRFLDRDGLGRRRAVPRAADRRGRAPRAAQRAPSSCSARS